MLLGRKFRWTVPLMLTLCYISLLCCRVMESISIQPDSVVGTLDDPRRCSFIKVDSTDTHIIIKHSLITEPDVNGDSNRNHCSYRHTSTTKAIPGHTPSTLSVASHRLLFSSVYSKLRQQVYTESK